LKIKTIDIPDKEALKERYGDFEVDYEALILFREKFTADEIIEFVINHKNFKSEWSDIGMSIFEGDALKFCNAINSLLVTWDQLALENYIKLLSNNPGDFVLEYISIKLNQCDFPNREIMLGFVDRIKKEFPMLVKYFDRVRETYTYDLKNKIPSLLRKKATPAEELRKQE